MKGRVALIKICIKTLSLSALLLPSIFLSSNVFAQTPAGSSMVLSDHWSIQSSANLTDDGKVISQPGYAGKDWYPPHQVQVAIAWLVRG